MDIQQDLLGKFRPSDTAGLRVVTRPRPVDRLQALILALRDEPTLKQAIDTELASRLAGSLLYGGSGFDLDFLQEVARGTFKHGTLGADISARTWPTTKIEGGGAWNFLPNPLRRQTMGIIGNGPAAVIMARIRTELRYLAKSTVIYGEQKNGLWAQPNVVGEGHNTFSDLNYFGTRMESRNGYNGAVLVDFLNDLRSNSAIEARGGTVWNLAVEPNSGRYSLYDKSGKKLGEHDSILIATGALQSRALWVQMDQCELMLLKASLFLNVGNIQS